MRRDGTTRFRDSQRAPLHDFLAVSSFSQYAVVDVNQVVKVDPAVPPKLACLLGCGAGTVDDPGVQLYKRRSYEVDRLAPWQFVRASHLKKARRSSMGVGQGGTRFVCAVFGLGSVGLAAIQGAKMCGAAKIIGVDLNPNKEKIGKSIFFGLCKVINAMTGVGADYCFECIGVSSVMTEAVRSTKPVLI
ncbi:hypothetical protein GUJ93_ZPchr0006g41187 [Zizania palustris]|uniref:Alcohol dehydrogenase-like C-terminal domain-containing protein n=1 Tax=Zizania palustris TaxID=103762 RepID=A0A8J5W2N5_ZIZPA|nr:hypothetical protein GUJ93_ZPchr0006g41187 [Zizania palustris]